MRFATRVHLFISLLIFSTCSLRGSAQQPNIIFIYADDWGYGDLSIHGHQTITTPNLDQLAAEGTEFLQFNVCNPVCSPSRVAIMTGHYPSHYQIHQHFADHQANMDRDMPDWLDPAAPLISRLFRNAGYRTAHYGKWHLTNGGVIDPPLPVDYGYDETYVFNGPGPQVGVPIGVSTGKCVDYCIDFISKDQAKPFFINLWIHESHTYIDPPEDAKAAYADVEEPFRSYYACISYADRELGRLFKYLKDEGLDSSTLVVFSSDNGPEAAIEDPARPEYYSRGETAGLRGRKRSLYEGGVGLPFIVHCPGSVPAGKINNTSTIAAVDILPTFCQIAGIDLPENYVSDGEDMSASLLGGDQQRTKPIFWDWRGPAGGENWPRMAIRSGNWKLLTDEDGSRQNLFNIQSNRVEQYDSLNNYPELADSLYLMVANWKNNLPTNIPIRNIVFYTNRSGDQVIVDFSNTGSPLDEVRDPGFHIYRSEKNIQTPIDSITHDSRKIYLHLSDSEPLQPDEIISIAFKSGKVTKENGDCLLFFSTEPVLNQIDFSPVLFPLAVTVLNGTSNYGIAGATVIVDTVATETSLSGSAYFHLPQGTYICSATKENYTSVEDTFNLFQETEIDLILYPTTATAKFRISDANSPVYQAEVIIDDKKMTTNTVGITQFTDLVIGNQYAYTVSRSGYDQISDHFLLSRDTTIQLTLTLNTELSASKKPEIILYPNPSIGKILLQSPFPVQKIEIFSIEGQLIHTYVGQLNNQEIDISKFGKGLFIFRIIPEMNLENPTVLRVQNL